MAGSEQLRAVLPEWEAFAHAVQSRRPDAGTWCGGWTVRDILIHNTGNTVEFIRVLNAQTGDPVETRSFEEREAPYRAMTDADLWAAFVALCEKFVAISEVAVRDLTPDTVIEFSGAKVGPEFFAKHMRNEIVLHGWDITGDDAVSTRCLMQPWVTEHSVDTVGPYLLDRGTPRLNLGDSDRVQGRLRAPGTDDVLIVATSVATTIARVPQDGEPTVESDPATRALFLWGRQPADPSRWHSTAGPRALQQLRTLLSGF